MKSANRSATKLVSALTCAAVLGLTALIAVPADAQNRQGNTVVRMLNHGSDGDERIYHVTCRDGTEGNVKVIVDSDQTCAQRVKGKQRCSKSWTLREAGQYVCSGR